MMLHSRSPNMMTTTATRLCDIDHRGVCKGSRAMEKRRLDTLLAERGLFASRSRAAASVMAGEVLLGPSGRRAAKPGELIDVEEQVVVKARPAFVSRGGIKLANALACSGVKVQGRRALDVGASTGGFTDCLLQRGAREVVAVDVGYGTLAWSLRTDPRVSVLERTNARSLTPAMLPAPRLAEPDDDARDDLPDRDAGPHHNLPDSDDDAREDLPDRDAGPHHNLPYPNDDAHDDRPDLATIDVSFISLAKVLGPVLGCLRGGYDVLALVKPQFEVGRARVGKGGVVREKEHRREALIGVGEAALACGAGVLGYYSSGLPGPKGNRETFIWLSDPAGAGGARGAGGPAELDTMAREVEP